MFIKLMVLALFIAVAGLFFVKTPDGKPMLTLEDLKPNIQLPDSLQDVLPTADGPGGDSVGVYRWQDAQGNWHYSDTDRSKTGAETLYFDPNTNVEPGLPMDKPGSEPTQTAGSSPSFNPLSNAKQLMEQAQQVQEMLNQREQAMREMQ